MNPTYQEMLRQPCECSLKCRCTRSHERECNGKGCSCWCHKPGERELAMEALQRAIKKIEDTPFEDEWDDEKEQ